jgi:large subunit ribosomal protein L22
MIIKAKQSTTWITPKKLRTIADAVRGKDLAQVNTILSTLNKRGGKVINETIRQAVANAVNNLSLPEETLTLKTLIINEGPRFKRFRAGARGMAKPYALRTSHIIVELESPDAAAPAKAAKPAVNAVKVEEAVIEAKEDKPVAKVAKVPAKKAAPKKVATKEASTETKKTSVKKSTKKTKEE